MLKKILKTKRLILREFTPADLIPLHAILSSKEVMHFSIFGPLNEQKTKAFLEKAFQSYVTYGYGKWAVIDKETNKLIGVCGLEQTDIGNDEIKTELGYRLAKKFWGKGLGTEAAQAVRDYAFETLNLDELISGIDHDNYRSIHIAKKNGFVYWKDGLCFGKPCKIYRMTREDWYKIRNQTAKTSSR